MSESLSESGMTITWGQFYNLAIQKLYHPLYYSLPRHHTLAKILVLGLPQVHLFLQWQIKDTHGYVNLNLSHHPQVKKHFEEHSHFVVQQDARKLLLSLYEVTPQTSIKEKYESWQEEDEAECKRARDPRMSKMVLHVYNVKDVTTDEWIHEIRLCTQYVRIVGEVELCSAHVVTNEYVAEKKPVEIVFDLSPLLYQQFQSQGCGVTLQ